MVAICQVVLKEKITIWKVYDNNNDKQHLHLNQASLKVCITMQNRKTHIHILTQPERREQEAKDVKKHIYYLQYPQNILKHTNTHLTIGYMYARHWQHLKFYYAKE